MRETGKITKNVSTIQNAMGSYCRTVRWHVNDMMVSKLPCRCMLVARSLNESYACVVAGSDSKGASNVIFVQAGLKMVSKNKRAV